MTDLSKEAAAASGPLGPQPGARPSLLDWLFSLPFLAAFAASLILLDPVQRVARLFGRRPHELVVGVLNVCLTLACRLCGTRFQVERDPAVLPGTPYLLLANHQSMFDIPILGAQLFSNHPKYVSKRELARGIPSISYNLRRGGNALIDRADRGQAVEAIRALGEAAQARSVSVVIYPEGTRSRAGELRPFKQGGAVTLLEAAPALQVVPVTIDGSWRLLSHNLLPVPFGTRIRLRLGAPMARDVSATELLARAQRDVEQTLLRWRGG